MEALRPDLSDAEFVAAMPKVELHVHIEGTLEPATLFDLAEANGIALPYDSPDGVLEFQTSQKTAGTENLTNFLNCLDISRGVLRTADDYRRMTLDFLRRCRAEGVRHVEVMFDPQQAIRQGVPFGDCMEGITQGRAEGRRDHGVRSEWIMCFQRDHPADEAYALIAEADPFRTEIVGIGVDNFETPGFPAHFQPTYDRARERGYRLTAHCDVNQPDSRQHIRACIEDLGVERIDHGLNTVDDPALIDLVFERDIALTGCPTFYAGQESAPIERLDMIRALLDSGIRISLNTDDPAQFGSGWINNTLVAAMQSAPFSRAEIVRFMQHGIDSAWIDDDYRLELTAELDAFIHGG